MNVFYFNEGREVVINWKRLLLSYRKQNGINDLDSDICFNTISLWDMYDHGTPCIVIFSYLIYLLISVVLLSPFFEHKDCHFCQKLVLVYDLYLATPYSQPSEHHERVFDKNNNCKKNLCVKSFVEICLENSRRPGQ